VDWSQELQRTWAQVVHFLPNLFGAILILGIGYIVGRLLEKAVDALLESVHFDRALERGGVAQALSRSGTKLDPSSVIAKLVFWAVMLVSIVMAANALELTAVATMFERLVAYIPNVIAAVVIVVLGLVIGNFVKGLIQTTLGGVGGGSAVAKLASVAIVTLSVFMALDQLGVAQNIVTTAFTLLLGAVALAAGLAFGLGNRELAGEMTRQWTEGAKETAKQLREQQGQEQESSRLTQRSPRFVQHDPQQSGRRSDGGGSAGSTGRGSTT
jgi:hypothetical protein